MERVNNLVKTDATWLGLEDNSTLPKKTVSLPPDLKVQDIANKELLAEGDANTAGGIVSLHSVSRLSSPNEGNQIVELLEQEKQAVEDELASLVNMMCSKSPQEFAKALQQAEKEYNASLLRLQKSLRQTKMSEGLLKSPVSVVANPTQQGAGPPPLPLAISIINTLSRFDFSADMFYSYENAQTIPNTPGEIQGQLGNITGKYRSVLKHLNGLSGIAASALWFSKWHAVKKAEESLAHLETLSKSGASGEDAVKLENEITELQNFITFEKQKLKEEAAILSLETTSYFASLTSNALSLANLPTYGPDIFSSLLSLGLAVNKYRTEEKSFAYLSLYQAELKSGSLIKGDITAHLEDMQKIEQKALEEIGKELAAWQNTLKGEIDVKEVIQKEFGIENFSFAVPTGKMSSEEFSTFVKQNKDRIVKEIAGHREAMNVTLRNAFRVAAQKKIEADKPLARWAVRSAKISLATAVLGVASAVLGVLVLTGVVALGMVATYLSLGVIAGAILGFAIGLAVLYYYKPQAFKHIFSLSAIRANYAKLRMARRTFDLVEAKHQKDVAAVKAFNLLSERIDKHLKVVELLKPKYSEDQQLELLLWQANVVAWKEAEYKKLHHQLGTLTLGHHLELGLFGIGTRTREAGKWLEDALVGMDADSMRAQLEVKIKKEFEKRGYTSDDSDLKWVAQLFDNKNSEDLSTPKFRSNLLIAYTTAILQKEIELQKKKAHLLFDSYETLEKYEKEYRIRLMKKSYEDATDRLVQSSSEWVKLFKAAPTNITAGFKSGRADSITEKFFKKELGIDASKITAENLSPEELLEIERYYGTELDVFLKQRAIWKR